MAASSWELEENVVLEILPANPYRDEYLIQLHTLLEDGSYPVWLAYGETAEVGKGICLGNQGHSVRIMGAKSRLAVSAVCEGTAAGGIETGTHIEYRHVLNWPAWWTNPQSIWPKQ